MVAAVTPKRDAGMWLPAEHFAARTTYSVPSIHPNLQQSLQQNKTAGLGTLEGRAADGR
jgi:hypothetical protein